MRVLITGASGFIGSRLIIAACAVFGNKNVIAISSKKIDGCQSIVYSNLNFSLNAAEENFLATVDVLIHAGAFTPKNGLEANKIEECNGNIIFTDNLLGLNFSKLKKIIYISTLDVYQAADLIVENTPTSPETLYGLSKLYCENMVTIFAEQKKILCQILRVGHVYGPGEERYEKFIPNVIKRIVSGDSIELWGDGAEIRSFIYIDDVVNAILKAVSLQKNVGIVNIVSGNPISIRDLLDKLLVIGGKEINIIYKEFNGIKRNYVFDNKKLRQYLLSDEIDFAVGLQAEYAHMASLK